MLSSRLRRGLLAAAVVVLCAGLWVGWQVWQTYRDLSAATDDAVTLQAAVTSGNDAASREAMAGLAEHTRSAADRTDGVTWDALAVLPVIGDDAEGVQVASRVLADLSERGLQPILDSVGDLGALTPTNGELPLDSISALQEPVAQAARAFAAAEVQLREQDSSGYTSRWKDRYRDLQTRVADAGEGLAAADRAVRVMPTMLGADGIRRYLVVFQNNAEVRATGGLPGAVAVVEADRGRISMVQQFAAASFSETEEPVLPLTEAEEEIYGRQLGTWFLDANFTPDFPRSAALWKARYEQAFPTVDGVLSVDPVALGYVLEATGPIAAGELTLTTDNVVETLLNSVYLTIADPVAQDAVFSGVAKSVFDQVTTGVAAPQVLLRALQRGAQEHRLYVHSFHPEEQAELTGTAVAGELVTDPEAPPQVGVYLNDNTGSKMSYYLRTRVDVGGDACVDGVQTLSGRARLTSLAPADGSLPASVTGGGVYGIAAGAQLVAVRLYAPVGGSVSDVELNGVPIEGLTVVEQDGRPVATAYVYLEATAVDVTWTMQTGPDQTGDVQVSVTPGIDERAASSVTPSVC